MFSKSFCFLGWLTTDSFGLLEGVGLVASEGCWHWMCLWLHVATKHGENQVPSYVYNHMNINQN